ncbi:unnamed protein product [Rhizopus stolonifer]
MFVISREVICLFYAVPYNKENAEKYTRKIDEMEDINVCYTKNQKRLRLLCTRIIYANSFDIHVYPSGSLQEETHEEIDQSNQEAGNGKLEIETTPQLKQFLNVAYLAKDLESVLYERKALSMNTILLHIWEYISLFKEESFSKFTNL